MVWRCEFTSLKYLAVLPTGRRLVTTVIGLKSAADATIKKIASALCSIPIRILKISFGIQVKLACLAFDCLFRALKLIKTRSHTCQESIINEEPDVSSETVVKGIKKVRKVCYMTYDQLFGTSIFADVDEVIELMREIERCRWAGDEEGERAAQARLDELDRPFQDGSWKEKFLTDLDIREETDTEESETEDDEPVNLLQDQSSKETQVSSSQSNEQNSFEREIQHKQLNGVPNNRPEINIVHENSVSKNRSNATNTNLEEVLKMSNLVGELKKLNSQVTQLTSVSQRMANMEQELAEGKKLLHSIEADRNEMKMKLLTLEHMIKEEEQYLDDVACESGYDECESPNLKSP